MEKKIVQDHINRIIEIEYPPKRIISLCPSITETLFSLKLVDSIVGRTSYCIYPEGFVHNVTIVGGTKQVDYEIIDHLNPDLIIAEKEENTKETVEHLSEKYPVYVTNVENYHNALQMITDLGKITDREKIALEIIKEIEKKFSRLKTANNRKGAYVIWRKPYMAAGNNTFINSILEKCGFINVFKDNQGRYPLVNVEDFQKKGPEIIFLSSEPFPFNESHISEFQEFMPNARLLLVKGEMFIWYGSHMLKTADYLNDLIEKLNL